MTAQVCNLKMRRPTALYMIVFILMLIITSVLSGTLSSLAPWVMIGLLGLGIVIFMAACHPKIGWYLVAGLIPFWAFSDFRIPLGPISMDPSLAVAAVCLAASALLVLFDRQHINLHYSLYLSIGFYLISILLSLLIMFNKGLPVLGGLASALRIFVGVGVALSLSVFDKEDIRRMLRYFLIGAGLLFTLTIAIRVLRGEYIISGSIFNSKAVGGKNQVAIIATIFFCVASSVYFIKPQLSLIDLWLFGVSSAALLMCFSRTAWVAAFVAFMPVFFSSSHKRRILLPTIALIVVAAVFAGELIKFLLRFETLLRLKYMVTGSVAIRLHYSRVAWELFSRAPFFGNGMGAFLFTLMQTPHNDYLWILGEQGLAGFIPFVAILASIWSGILRNLRLDQVHQLGVKLSSEENPDRWVWIALISMMLGILILFLQNDSHEVMPVWFFLGLGMSMCKRRDLDVPCTGELADR